LFWVGTFSGINGWRAVHFSRRTYNSYFVPGDQLLRYVTFSYDVFLLTSLIINHSLLSRFEYAYINQINWYIIKGPERLGSKILSTSARRIINLKSWLFLIVLVTHSFRNMHKAVSVRLSKCWSIKAIEWISILFRNWS
jgi:hypothetical protein